MNRQNLYRAVFFILLLAAFVAAPVEKNEVAGSSNVTIASLDSYISSTVPNMGSF